MTEETEKPQPLTAVEAPNIFRLIEQEGSAKVVAEKLGMPNSTLHNILQGRAPLRPVYDLAAKALCDDENKDGQILLFVRISRNDRRVVKQMLMGMGAKVMEFAE